MEIKIRSDEKLYMDELKAWLLKEKNTPLEEMSSFFERRLGGYEEHMSEWKDAYGKMAQMIPADAQRILDLGCGTGLELDEIFKIYPSVSVTGIDLCSAMLDRLREKHGDKDIELICADYFAADLGTERYDLVVSFKSLHHFTFEQKRILYQKVYDTLKDGGIFMECDYIACCDEEEQILFAEYLRKRAESSVAEDSFVHFDIPLTADHETQALENGGFKKIKMIDSVNGAVFIMAEK